VAEPRPGGDNVDMRIVVTGDRFWNCHPLAASVIRRLVDRYGPGVVIVHGEGTGVEESFATAANGLGVAAEAHPAEWDRLGLTAGPIRNGAMIRAGADLCIVVHRFLMNSKISKDCARQAIEAGIPTYLIDSDKAGPRRLHADDPRLG
jgi:hypothetical protein